MEAGLHRFKEKTKETHHELIGLGVGLIGVGGLVSGLEQSVHAAAQAETAQAKLRVAVKNAGLSWKGNRVEIEEFIKRQSEAKGFMEADLVSAFSGFVRVTQNSRESMKLLNTAMDLSRATGKPLGAAQLILTRAYNGSFVALKRLLPTLTVHHEAQDKLQATTKHATAEQRRQAIATDKQRTATDALSLASRKFGGQANAYAKTGAGSYARLRVNIHDAEATIGKALMPTLAHLANKAADVAVSFQRHWPEIKQDIHDIVQPVKDVGGAIGGFVKHNPELAKAAASVAIMAGAAHKLGAFKFTGALARLVGLGGGARGLGGAGGVVGKVLGEKPVPVFVTNKGGLPGLPGSGPEPAPTKAPSRLGSIAGTVARYALPATVIGGVAYLGFKHLGDTADLSAKQVARLRFQLDAERASGKLSDQQAGRLRDQFDRLAKRGGPWAGAFRQVSDALDSTSVSGRKLNRQFGQTADGISGAMSQVARSVKHGTDSGQQDIASLSKHSRSDLSRMAHQGQISADQLHDAIANKTDGARRAGTRNVNRMGSGISHAFDLLNTNVFSSLNWIQAQVTESLSGLGAGTVKFSISRSKALKGFPHQKGGRFFEGGWLGARGMVSGVDNIPLGGGNMAAAGEGVVTRWQAPAIEQGMQIAQAATGGAYPFGSLDDVFARIRRPHGLQQGGRPKGFQAGGNLGHARRHVFSLPQLAGLWIAAGGPRSAASIMAHVAEAESTGKPWAANSSGADGLWQILGLPFNGDPFDPITNAKMAVAKYRGGGLGPWAASRGNWGQFLGAGGITPAGISAPNIARMLWHGGPRTLRRIGQASTDRVTRAANAYVGHQFAAQGAVGPTGAVGGPAGVTVYKGVAMARWVADSLRYAAARGAGPQPTSGYRPGYDPHTVTGHSEHSGTRYPHGAVDFGGYTGAGVYAKKMSVVNATRGFKWPLLAPIGFSDAGHASGTGHQRGGRLGPLNRVFPTTHGFGRQKHSISINDLRAIGEEQGMTPSQAYIWAQTVTYESGGVGGKWGNPGEVAKDGGTGLNQATPSAWGHRGPLWNWVQHHGGMRGQRNPFKAAGLALFASKHGGWNSWFTGVRGQDPLYKRAKAYVARNRIRSVLPGYRDAGTTVVPSGHSSPPPFFDYPQVDPVTQAQFDVTRASLTSGTGDDIRAYQSLVTAERARIHADERELHRINVRLHQRLTPRQRRALVGERGQVRDDLTSIIGSFTSDRDTLAGLKHPDTTADTSAADLATAIKDLKASIDAQTDLARKGGDVLAATVLRSIADHTLSVGGTLAQNRARGRTGYATVGSL